MASNNTFKRVASEFYSRYKHDIVTIAEQRLVALQQMKTLRRWVFRISIKKTLIDFEVDYGFFG